MIKWLMLADGAPIARRDARLTGEPWPRLTGADLLPSLLAVREEDHRVVGFLGTDAARVQSGHG